MSAPAATIALYEFSLQGTDSLAFIADSIVGSTDSTRFMRFRPSIGTISKMASDVPPNTNLVSTGTHMWFTERYAPYRIGRADLSTVTGSPMYFTAGVGAGYDDMALGADKSLWATNAASSRVVRVTQTGTLTTYSGNGSIHPVGITRAHDGAMWYADGVNRRIGRIDPNTGAFAEFPVPQLSAATVPERVTATPDSDDIWFATRDGFGRVDAATGDVRVVATEAQQPKRIAAAADGTLWLTTGDQNVTQFTPPSAFAKLKVFENADAQSAGLYIDPSGAVYVSDPQGWQLARIAPARETAPDTTVVEFHNADLDHYVVTADPVEAAAIDAGTAGAGWARTGQSWRAWAGGPIPNASEVCRFYGSPDIDASTGSRRGPNSHFYTAEPAECAAVKGDAGWRYEAAATFWMVRPTGAGECPSWTQPVYRAYNQHYATNDSNHRYTTDTGVYAAMIARGWRAEGVVMCAPIG